MSYDIKTITYKSTNYDNNVKAYIYIPECQPSAVLQISHGMCEYVARYAHFSEFLSSHGIILCGNDHIGHGNSVPDKSFLGYFKEKDGWKFAVRDVNILTVMMKKEYPNLPYFLLGHSMGSFIARSYCASYGDGIDGVILSGTSGTNPLSGVGKLAAKLVCLIKGDMYRSKLLNKLAFGNFNRKYTDVKSRYDWLTKDRGIVTKYENDEFCNFIFTARGFVDLSDLLSSVSQNKWYESFPKNLPVFLIGGEMDPVGNFGKGVNEVFTRLKEKGVSDVSMKLYENDRHEILNELDREVVYNDILDWMEKHKKQQ